MKQIVGSFYKLKVLVVGDAMLDTYIKAPRNGFAEKRPFRFSMFGNNVRPEQQHIEFWENGVLPETIVPKGEKWQRYLLHNAANLLHGAGKVPCFCCRS